MEAYRWVSRNGCFIRCDEIGFFEPLSPTNNHATYCEGDEELARKYDHSTASQAAESAKACSAGKLLPGHFLSRYKTEDCFLECATRHFPNIALADYRSYSVPSKW